MPATADSLQADLLNAPPGCRGLPAVDLDLLSTEATLLAEEFGQVGGDWHSSTKMVRRLQNRFAVAAPREGEDASDAADAQKEVQAIGEFILARGGKDISSPGKVWSYVPQPALAKVAGSTEPAEKMRS